MDAFGAKRIGVNMFPLRKNNISSVEKHLPLDEIRKRARILVVDDDEKAFPYKLLEKEGYNIVWWPKIESLRLLENGEYDLIVLDINGIVSPDISLSDGIGVLEHLKKHNPAQLIIAYSGQKYDLSQERFWKIADDYLGKPSSLINCKEKIDALLKESFTPTFYWNSLVSILVAERVPQKNIEKIEKIMVKNMQGRKSFQLSDFQTYLALGHYSLAIANTLIQIISRFSIGA